MYQCDSCGHYVPSGCGEHDCIEGIAETLQGLIERTKGVVEDHELLMYLTSASQVIDRRYLKRQQAQGDE